MGYGRDGTYGGRFRFGTGTLPIKAGYSMSPGTLLKVVQAAFSYCSQLCGTSKATNKATKHSTRWVSNPTTRFQDLFKDATPNEVLSKGVLSILVKTFGGLHREEYDGVELETKLDVCPLEQSPGLSINSLEMRLGEVVLLPKPYLRDLILDQSQSLGGYYATQHDLNHAFTVVEHAGGSKIKEKESPTYTTIGGITVIERPETNTILVDPISRKKSPTTPPIDLDAAIKQHIKVREEETRTPIVYIGSIMRTNKECFVINPSTGRVFVIETHKAVMYPESEGQLITLDPLFASLFQIEIEYHGTLKGVTPCLDLKADLAKLTDGVRENLHPLGYKGTPSILTKYQWCLKQAKQTMPHSGAKRDQF